MIWSGLQARQPELVEPLADGAFMHLDREPACHLGSDVQASPAHHIMFCRIRTLDDQFSQLGLLRLRQGRHTSRRRAGFQAVDAFGVVAMHPIAQGLPVHAIERRRLAARIAVKNEGQSQKTAHLRSVRAFAGDRPQVSACVVRPSDAQRRAHPKSPSCGSHFGTSNRN
jgi:hypothetical protein